MMSRDSGIKKSCQGLQSRKYVEGPIKSISSFVLIITDLTSYINFLNYWGEFTLGHQSETLVNTLKSKLGI